MPTRDPSARSAVLSGRSDPLTKARLLVALLGGPLSPSAARDWEAEHDAADAVTELLAAGSVRRTAGGGLALDARRHDTALAGLAADLRLPSPRTP
jgi:hypothetical protein